MVGGDGRGSWQMRGVQLGRAMGARVTTEPSARDWAWAEIVVLVKRAAMKWAGEAKRCQAPVVWDALDFWSQPGDNDKPREWHIEQAIAIARNAGVDRIVCATQAMASDLGGVYLPHHGRIGLTPTPPRQTAQVVGYDGTRKYLGTWLTAIQRACDSMGLEFAINPPDLSAVDVLVAFRDGRWDGEVCRRWKSGVKYVNAICAGRPIVSYPCASLSEIKPSGPTIETRDELADALVHAASYQTRVAAHVDAGLMAESFSLEAVSIVYRSMLSEVARKAA